MQKYSRCFNGKTVRFISDNDGAWVNIEDIGLLIEPPVQH